MANHPNSETVPQQTTQFRGGMISPPFFGPEEIEIFAGVWNGNLVRWQLNFGFPHGEADTASVTDYFAWLDAECDRFDQMIPHCRRLGLRVCLDLHTAPGGFDPDDFTRVLYLKEYQDAFLEAWGKLATRYRGEPVIWAYDLLNEPNQWETPRDDSIDWPELATAAARRIREIDAETPIIFEPTPWGTAAGFVGLKPIDVPNVIYSFHHYEPFPMTHQTVSGRPGGIVYPGVIDGVQWDKERMRESMRPVIEFQQRYGVPIFVGEFGAIRWAPDGSAFRFMKDSIELFEELGWDWTYHAFREWEGWSVEHSSDRDNREPAAEPTDRERLIRDAFSKNVRKAIP